MPDGKSQALLSERENIEAGRSNVEGHLSTHVRSNDCLLAESSKFTHSTMSSSEILTFEHVVVCDINGTG